jgi:hypothetical protein
MIKRAEKEKLAGKDYKWHKSLERLNLLYSIGNTYGDLIV